MPRPWVLRFRSTNLEGEFYGEAILTLLHSSEELRFPDAVFNPEDYFFVCNMTFRGKRFRLEVDTEVVEENEQNELREFDLCVTQQGPWFQRAFWKTAPGGPGECFQFLKSLIESDRKFTITFVGELPERTTYQA